MAASRAMQISYFIVTVMFSLTLLHQVNACYHYGYDAVIVKAGYSLSVCPIDSQGVGHPFIPVNYNPLFGYEFRDANNNVVDTSDFESYNRTMHSAITYSPTPDLTDIFGIFSWVLNGIRILSNTFFMPVYGFPEFLMNFHVPYMLTLPLGTLLFLIQIIAIYEIASGRRFL